MRDIQKSGDYSRNNQWPRKLDLRMRDIQRNQEITAETTSGQTKLDVRMRDSKEILRR